VKPRELTVDGERVHVTAPAPRDVWRELLAADPFALISQSPEWLDARCTLGGHIDASRLYETVSGRRIVLPLVRRAGLSGRLSLQSSFGDGWGIGGPLVAGGVRRADVVLVAADLLEERPLRTVLRPNPLLAREWDGVFGAAAVAVPRRAHVLDLSGGFDQVWATRFRPGARANVRKAERAGVTVERGRGPEHVAAFNRLFELSIERWSARHHEPVLLARLRTRRRDPPEKFRVLAEAVGDGFGIWVATLDGRAIAATIVLRGLNAHYTRGAMDEAEAGRTRANYLLQAAAIEDACAAGCRHYHFGESGGSTSLAHFKSRFGAEAVPYEEYRVERLPLTAADRRLRGAAKRVIGFRDAA
jgi:hypothetical protein